MLSACKDILQNVITDTTTISANVILRSVREEAEALKTGSAPFAVLTANDADFDNRHARIDQYYDQTMKIFKRRYVRGERRIPFVLKIYTDTEQALSDYLDKIIPAIPREFTYDGYSGSILIAGEVYSEPEVSISEVNNIEPDYATVHLYSATVQILFAIVTAKSPEDVLTAQATEQTAEQKK